MNAQLPLTDDRIRAAIARRATAAEEHDLRERVLAATAAVRQRRAWRTRVEQLLVLPERKARLTLVAVVLLLVAMAMGIAVVGSLLDRTAPAQLRALAFLSGGDLYVADPTGALPKLAWDAPETEYLTQPMWVDATTVVIEGRRLVDGVTSVYVVDIATGTSRLVDADVELLALSPDHGRLATLVIRTSRLRILDLATGSLVADLGVIQSTEPLSWSPDDRWLLGEGSRDGSGGLIYRLDVGTGEVSDLATGLCCNLHRPRPVLSPDGSRVAFVDYYQAAQGDLCDFRCGTIWSLDPATGARQRLTAEEGSEIGPVFSPDNAWIAFLEWAGAGYDVAVVRADGTGRRKLTETGDAYAPPANLDPFRYLYWDPDGAGLTFMRGPSHTPVGAPRPPEYELWHVTFDGQVEQRIGGFVVSEFST